jgi:hypothetical protein
MKNKQTKHDDGCLGLEGVLDKEVMLKYNEFIVREALKNNRSVKKILDFGAGIGTLAMIFKNKFLIETLCVEVDEKNKALLSKRNLTHFDSLEEVNEDLDLIFSSYVQNIEDDISILKDMGSKLSANGKIYLYLPAKMFLWSDLDEKAGHFRRYEIGELKAKCRQAGLKIEKLHYADCIGFFASLSMKVIGFNNQTGVGSTKSLKFYDKWIFPVSNFLDQCGFKKIFGKNIILIASNN